MQKTQQAEQEEAEARDRYLISPAHIQALEGRRNQAVLALEHARAHKVSKDQDAFIRALATEVVSLGMQLVSARQGLARSRHG